MSGGDAHRVYASGTINARPPASRTPQVEFKLATSGSVHNSCRAVKLELAWLVTACRAGEARTAALQSWQRRLPNLGARPDSSQAAWELRLSHWTGPTAVLEISLGWAYRRFLQLFGTYTYRRKPVFGYRVRSGVPLDGYGRNIYVDALNSDLGKGWKRVNSFLAHQPLGAFCYGFYPHGGHRGVARKYRATVIGPAVTPDVMWQGTAPSAYAADADAAGDALMLKMLGRDRLCRPT